MNRNFASFFYEKNQIINKLYVLFFDETIIINEIISELLKLLYYISKKIDFLKYLLKKCKRDIIIISMKASFFIDQKMRVMFRNII